MRNQRKIFVLSSLLLTVMGGIFLLSFFLVPSCQKGSSKAKETLLEKKSLPEEWAHGGLPDPIGPVTQSEFEAMLDSGQLGRISVGAQMPDDAGTGIYWVGVGLNSDGEILPGCEFRFVHFLDYEHFEDAECNDWDEYGYEGTGWEKERTIALFNLMREKNFFNLNVTRDPNGGPNRYYISASIVDYGENQEDYRHTTIFMNVRDTSTPDNAAYFEVMDFIKTNFVDHILNNWICKQLWRNGKSRDDAVEGAGCPRSCYDR